MFNHDLAVAPVTTETRDLRYASQYLVVVSLQGGNPMFNHDLAVAPVTTETRDLRNSFAFSSFNFFITKYLYFVKPPGIIHFYLFSKKCFNVCFNFRFYSFKSETAI